MRLRIGEDPVEVHPGGDTSDLRFRVLGPLEVERGGYPVGLGGPKPRFDRLWERGRGLDIDEAIGLAIGAPLG